jgi:UDP:flavonoid glycosyltransferase YjiC (YdhE family)
MLPLIRAAVRSGHDVRVATGPDLVGPLGALGLDVYSIGPSWETAWAAHDEVWSAPDVPEAQKKKMVDGAVALFGTPAIARLNDLMLMVTDWRPEVVVHEVLEQAGSLLAARLGIPGVTHGIGPMFPFYAQFIDALGLAIGEPERWAQLSTEQALDLCPPSLQPDGPRPWPAAGAVRPSAGEHGELPPQVTEALASAGPVAYFTLGTVKNADPRDFRTGLQALEEYDGTVIATTGRPLSSDTLGRLPSNVVVAAFAPQSALLERADLLVSHSGSGTMLGGLVHGVPQVALPRGTDQPENAALLVRAGAGLLVAPEDYAVESIAAAVAQVTRNPSFRDAAERVRDEIADMPDADSAWADLVF